MFRSITDSIKDHVTKLDGLVTQYKFIGGANDNEISYTKTIYDPQNKNHKRHILNKVTSFSKNLNSLVTPDEVAFVGLSLSILFALTQYLHPITCVVPAAILVYVVWRHLNRPEKIRQLNADLHELYDIYQWCAKDKTAAITHDRSFIHVLDAIAPFVPTMDLILWKAYDIKKDDISPEFAHIMSFAPHSIPTRFMQDKKIDELSLEIRKWNEPQMAWPRFYYNDMWRSIASKCYGDEMKKEVPLQKR